MLILSCNALKQICGNVTANSESSRLTPSQMSGTLSILGGSLVTGAIVAAVSYLQLGQKGKSSSNTVGVVSRFLGKAEAEAEDITNFDAQDVRNIALALKSLTQTVASLGEEVSLLREEKRRSISGKGQEPRWVPSADGLP